MTDIDDLIARLLAVDVDSDHDCYMNAPIFAEAAAALESLRDEVARKDAALRGVMVGGNHLAIWLPQPCPPLETEPLAALEQIGAGVYYDVWCCWRSIMQARAALKHQ